LRYTEHFLIEERSKTECRRVSENANCARARYNKVNTIFDIYSDRDYDLRFLVLGGYRLEHDSRVINMTRTNDLASFQFHMMGPVGRIEAVLTRPTESSARRAVGVICHPHPLYDGSLHNKVTHTLAHAFNDLGVPAFRFNFRGVGESEGFFDGGNGETADLLAVISEARRLFPHRELWLAGFSFGAYVALRACQQTHLTRLITVAPPVNLFDFSGLHRPQCEWTVIQGDQDDIVPAADVLRWAQSQRPAPQIIQMEQTGHFFHRRLGPLRSVVTELLSETARSEPRFANA